MDPLAKVSILSPLAMLQLHHHKPKKSWIRRYVSLFCSSCRVRDAKRCFRLLMNHSISCKTNILKSVSLLFLHAFWNLERRVSRAARSSYPLVNNSNQLVLKGSSDTGLDNQRAFREPQPRRLPIWIPANLGFQSTSPGLFETLWRDVFVGISLGL